MKRKWIYDKEEFAVLCVHIPENKSAMLSHTMCRVFINGSVRDTHAIGEEIASLPDLVYEIAHLRERLAEERKWAHMNCTKDNCVASGVDCPARTPGVANEHLPGL